MILALAATTLVNHLPAIVIDPEGERGNLLVTFPRPPPDEFAPWRMKERAPKTKR